MRVDGSDGTDAELLQRVAGGDQRALSVVFDRHAPAVTRYAWAIAASRMDVEEIVQDTFVTMWRKSSEITIAEASVLPWLLVTCRNLGRNAARKAARHQADELDETSTNRSRADALRDHHDAESARDDLRWVPSRCGPAVGPQGPPAGHDSVNDSRLRARSVTIEV